MGRLNKYQFFEQLGEHVGKKIALLSGGNVIANVEVKKLPIHSCKAFRVSVFYTGKTAERRAAKWEDKAVHISCNSGFDNMSYHEKLHFHLRSFDVQPIEPEKEKTVETSKQVPFVVIEGTAKENNVPDFHDLRSGEFFWYESSLWQKNDDDGATRTEDGYYDCDWDGEKIVPQKVRVVCVD